MPLGGLICPLNKSKPVAKQTDNDALDPRPDPIGIADLKINVKDFDLLYFDKFIYIYRNAKIALEQNDDWSLTKYIKREICALLSSKGGERGSNRS